MKKLQKTLGIIIMAALFVLSGCGGEETKSDPTKASSQTEAKATEAPKEDTKQTEAPKTEKEDAAAADQTQIPEAEDTQEPVAEEPENKLNKNGWIFTGKMTHDYGTDTFTDGGVAYVKSEDAADYYWGFRHLNEISLKAQKAQMGGMVDPEYEAMMRQYFCDGNCGGMGACGSFEGFLYVSSETGKKYALAANNYYLIEFTTMEQLEKDYNACEDFFWGELAALPEIETETNEWGDVIRYDRWKGWTFNGDVRTNGTHTLTKVAEEAGFHTYEDENGISYTYQAEEGTWLFNVNFK